MRQRSAFPRENMKAEKWQISDKFQMLVQVMGVLDLK